MSLQAARRHFLCDMENVQNRWAGISDMLCPGDRVTVFVSEPASKFDLMPFAQLGHKDVSFRFCRCGNGRPNAMDFQIMCELGRLSVLEPDSEFILVTADKCFESVIKYMSDRNASVRRVDPEDPVDTAPDEPVDSVQDEYRERLLAAGVTDPRDLRIYAAILCAAMAEPQNRRKLGCMNRLIQKYGTTDGRLRYVAVKDLVHDIADHGPYPDAPRPGKPALSTDEVNKALGRHGVPLKEGMVKKAVAAVQAARTAQDPASALEKRAKGIFTPSSVKSAMKALEPFL